MKMHARESAHDSLNKEAKHHLRWLSSLKWTLKASTIKQKWKSFWMLGVYDDTSVREPSFTSLIRNQEEVNYSSVLAAEASAA